MKRILLIIFPLCLSLTITGCSLQDLLGKKQKSQSSSQSQQKTVFAVALNEQDPNKALIQRGIEDMAQKENVEVKVISPGTAGGKQEGSSSSGQSSQGSSSANSSKNESSQGQSSGGTSSKEVKGAKVFIYQGGNPELLQSVQEEKIPVVALNELPAGVKPAGIILPDPQKAGELMAQPVLSKVTEGQVVILQGDPSESTSQELLAAIRQALGKNPKITIQVIASPSGSEAAARQGFMDLIQKNPDKVQAVIAQNEKLAAQASEVLKSHQLEKKVLLVGGQANQQSLQRMAGGTQVADVDTSPYIQGVNAFQWAQKIANKETLDINESLTGDQGEVPAKIVPVKIVTSENLAVVQKSYTKAAEAAAKASSESQQKQGSSSGGNQSQKDSGSQGGSQGQKGSSGQGQSQSQSGATGVNVPQGATKVMEKVQTTITREYLDDQGKVLGTEKSTSEQNRTVPPQMLQQEAQQKSQQGQQDKQDKQGQGQGGQSGQKDQKS